MNEQQIRAAMRGIAEADPAPDEAAAWQTIRSGIEAEQRSGRLRTILGVSGLAIAGAAAALVLITSTGDDREAVEVIPADTSTTTDNVVPATSTTVTTAPTETSGAAAVLGPLPARPVAVVVAVDGGPSSRLDLYDADTGQLVVRDLARSEFGIDEISIVGETIYFTEEFGDSSTVRMVAWDGSAGPATPFDLDTETNGGTLSPDGSEFAYVRHGVTIPQASIGIIDTASGEQRTLAWASDDEDFFHTNGSIHGLQWSPDGDRLLFTSSYEGSEVLAVDADAASLSEATPFELAAFGAHWLSDDTVIGVRFCCYPDFAEPAEVQRVNEAGDVETVEVEGDADGGGGVAGRHDRGRGRWSRRGDRPRRQPSPAGPRRHPPVRRALGPLRTTRAGLCEPGLPPSSYAPLPLCSGENGTCPQGRCVNRHRRWPGRKRARGAPGVVGAPRTATAVREGVSRLPTLERVRRPILRCVSEKRATSADGRPRRRRRRRGRARRGWRRACPGPGSSTGRRAPTPAAGACPSASGRSADGVGHGGAGATVARSRPRW